MIVFALALIVAVNEVLAYTFRPKRGRLWIRVRGSVREVEKISFN